MSLLKTERFTPRVGLALLVLVGCSESSSAPDVAIDGGDSCTPATSAVDVLFVVEDYALPSAQQAMGVETPHFLEGLRTTGFDDIRVGVVTTDMGVGGHAWFTCNEPFFGDDGVLRQAADHGRCEEAFPRFLEFGDDASAFEADMMCLLAQGTNGCGFEQPLEAMLKALSPSNAVDAAGEPLRFFEGTTGHGDGANAGFLRPDAVLLVVVLMTEDDCSFSDPGLFDVGDPRFEETVDRCWDHPSALHPVSRYVDGLLALREHPSRIVYAPIAGVPVELVHSGFVTILDDPRMSGTPDPEEPHRISNACNAPGVGASLPARRLISVARDLAARGAHGVIGSACQQSYETPVDDILAALSAAREATCE